MKIRLPSGINKIQFQAYYDFKPIQRTIILIILIRMAFHDNIVYYTQVDRWPSPLIILYYYNGLSWPKDFLFIVICLSIYTQRF